VTWRELLGLHGIPLDADLGLLILRVTLAALMIVFHGWEKLLTARRQFHTFPNLIGISSELSYVLVVWFEDPHRRLWSFAPLCQRASKRPWAPTRTRGSTMGCPSALIQVAGQKRTRPSFW
jgi:hypothetical protein